ncbi:nitrous oxide reductase accessory protein NosL [Natronolimnohabitans sp. A-GB9]|uniref:nitrous oxide reductase accessory protein NosL n=1 Tax=Natronolimnohabitans sp. A-GB9 TaxID=3069757 RepID=UPI0027B791D2|nr:nitrous oxide reductase accessory protein NosL [Natronolimnohabitans sp. A-GB9]MDQ2050063.1 nitrous oxide reductase accessory protein NosL [Natronolimnohabitans sp. A-GB9]
MRKSFDSVYHRRAILGSIGAGAAVGLAGCLGGDDENGEENGDENGDENGEENGEENGDENGDENGEETASLEEPAEFPEGRDCAVCSMEAGDYPDWNAQLVHEDEHREFFCSAGCMAAYYAAPEEFDGSDAAVEGVWVTDFETGELIDGTEAYYVRVTDPDHVDDIMMRNPTPFAERSDAEAFVDEFDEYDDEDIITLEDFDRDLAELYRSRFFEED